MASSAHSFSVNTVLHQSSTSESPINTGENQGRTILKALASLSPNDPEYERWQSVCEAIDSFVGEKMDEAIENALSDKVESLRESVLSLVQAVRVQGSCHFCSRFMEVAYTLECGDALCGSCVKHTISAQLDKVLDKISNLRSIPRSMLPLPSNRDQLLAIEQVLTASHVDTSKVFVYECPYPMCSATVAHPPIIAYQQGSLISNVVKALKDEFPRERAVACDRVPQCFFEAFFP